MNLSISSANSERKRQSVVVGVNRKAMQPRLGLPQAAAQPGAQGDAGLCFGLFSPSSVRPRPLARALGGAGALVALQLPSPRVRLGKPNLSRGRDRKPQIQIKMESWATGGDPRQGLKVASFFTFFEWRTL